jgi:hypothetical protein
MSVAKTPIFIVVFLVCFGVRYSLDGAGSFGTANFLDPNTEISATSAYLEVGRPTYLTFENKY